ncbi:MAG TPA: VWA domain-containing protein [Pyrinomonadaceae bacterium]|nr:VWA domain-containing protein [Pyrinomonadaceae bacterium]
MRPSRERLLRISTALLLLLLASLTAGAQEKKDKKDKKEQAPPFSVSLNVTVLDAQGRPADGLKREDFQLTEDGVAQPVASAEPLEGPLAFGLVVDNSGSMLYEINTVVGLGHLLVRESGADTSAFVISFISGEQINLMEDFTTDKRALEAALDAMYIEGGQTAVNDALYVAAEHLEKFKAAQTSPRRYALVLITDGEDRSSYYKTEKVLEKLRAVGVPVFVVGLPEEASKQSPERVKRYMGWVAAGTGGATYFYEKNKTGAAALARQVLAAMGANYRVTYTPTNQKRDSGFRRVQVSVGAGAAGEPRKALTKEGYFAPPK